MPKMDRSDANKRHQQFKRELRAYHQTINDTNRYRLDRIVGKLNLFEAKELEDDGSYEIDRKIPNTGLTVLKRGELYALGDIDGKPITDFKYQFVEGCLGDHEKVVRCITDTGDIEDFDVETETIMEDAAAAPQTAGIGVGEITSDGCGRKDYTEIDYSDVSNMLKIPYLCGARVVDMQKRKKRRHKRR